MSGAAIELREVSRIYAETGAVLENLGLEIPSGQFVSLLGPSGCGKSTLLRLIADLEKPSSGQVKVASGERSFVFQESHLLPWRSALENAALPLEIHAVEKDERRKRARAALENLGLGDALAKFPHQLSGGMKMRVSVARALVGEPQLLLLDEPFSALDDVTRHHLQEDLRTLWRARGMTVVFVTHSIAEAVFLSDRILVLSGRPARVLSDRDILSELGAKRGPETRLAPEYLRLVGELGHLYARKESAR